MAYRSARGWNHVWCNVNEALVDERTRRSVWPSTWRFLGSRVLVRDRVRVVLESNHEVDVSGGRLRMDRYATFAAGETFFQLAVVVTALGPGQVDYAWLYGDEPWVGYFGSAERNVGWVEEGMLQWEGSIDPLSHRWAGILDLKTGLANYLEWQGDEPPEDFFFSNGPGRHADSAQRVPLSSNEVFIGLQWRHQRLGVGASRSYRLAIGLAEIDPERGIPRRPAGAR